MIATIDDQIIEAILGTELTRKLDDYTVIEAIDRDSRSTRLDAVRTAVEVTTGLAQMGLEIQRREQQQRDRVLLLKARGYGQSKIMKELGISRTAVLRALGSGG